jgi:spermidine/putrescine transport system substrate-binding protein
MQEFFERSLKAKLSRRQFIRGVGGITVLTVAGPTVLAARSSAASPTTGPALGGVLNFIGYPGEDAATVAKPFLDANSIKVQPTYIASPDEPLTKFKTGGRGQMDIISDNKDFQKSVLTTGEELYAPLDMSRIPNAAGLFPAFQNAPWYTKDGQVYGVGLIWGDEPCVYDPAKWDGVPAKYTDFADAKYKGELVFVDDPIANTWLFGKSLGYPDPSHITQAQLDAVMEALRTVKPNIVTFSVTLGDQADVLIRGDASIAVGGWAYQIVLAEQKGVTLASASPSADGTYHWSDSYGIAIDAPNPDNAYGFIDYMVSPEANAAIATELGSGATIEKALDFMDDKTKALYPYDIVREAGGGILGTENIVPPSADEGDIVGLPKWTEAWQAFKVS